MTNPDYDAMLESMDAVLKGGLDPAKLREIQQIIDDVAFIPGLKDHIRQRKSNQPGVVENQIRSLLRLAERLEARQDTDSRFMMTAGVGGSASLIVGGALLVAAPPVAVTFAVAGMIVAGVSYFGVRKIDRDKLLCSQIVGALRKIDEDLRNGRRDT